MKVIRHCIFETNSSSSHSLVIKKKSEYFSNDEIKRNFWLNNKGKLEFWDGELEFGRSPFTILSSPEEKLRYLIASYSQDDDKISEIIRMLDEILGECNGIEFSLSRWTKEEDRGGVDHESVGLLKRYFKENNNVSFKEFILNKKYVIVIDGDEYDEWGKLKNSNLINISEIEAEFPQDYNESDDYIYE